MNGLAILSPVSADGIRLLTLNRAEKSNALAAPLVEELHARVDEVGSETRVLVIRAEGRNFCAGFDMSGIEAASEGELLLRFVRIDALLHRIRRAPCLTVAWVKGAAYGAGADIACACAVRVGVGAPRFRFPGFQFGVALGSRRLGTVVGLERARRILMGNEELDAAAAMQCGLLTDLAAEEDPGRFTSGLARQVRRLDGQTLQTLNRLTDVQSSDADLAELVRSVSRPGLHQRIAAYRAESA